MTDASTWAGKPSTLSRIAKGIAVVLTCVLILFPFLVVVSTSLSDADALRAAGGYVVLPKGITFAAYQQILAGGSVTRAVVITGGVTLVGTAISIVTTVLAAWALSRPGSLFHRSILNYVLVTFLFVPGIIPLYLVVKSFGMLDTYWSLILPTAFSVFNLVVVRGFMMGLPQEVIDAARIDGAGEWRLLVQVVVPMCRAVIAVVTLFYAVGYWNSFFNALLYLSDTSKWTLQLLLRTYVLQGSTLVANDPGQSITPPSESIQMAVVVIAIVPILAVYPLVQRHLTKGVITGAVKG